MLWYSGSQFYDYNNPGFSTRTGGFTQVVWKSTTDVGFGIAQAADSTIYVVANYFPPGNIPRNFDANVLQPNNSKKDFPFLNRIQTTRKPLLPTKQDSTTTPFDTTVTSTNITTPVVRFELFKLDSECNLVKFYVPVLQKIFQFSYCNDN